MSCSATLLKTFSEQQLDEAECLIKRERPDLWRVLTHPMGTQCRSTGFYRDFLKVVSPLTCIDELPDVVSLSYALAGRREKLP
jgi:hypothetical protein